MLEHDLDPEPERGPAVEEARARGVHDLAGHSQPGDVRWRDQIELLHAGSQSIVGALPTSGGFAGAGRCGCAADRGADLVPAGDDPGLSLAVPMKRFGAEIFVADLIGLSMLRELGPLMTAILLAGRSGAAFAAEIGTMRVHQAIDALTTMGLDPVRFGVTPRVIAALLMTPLLVLFANLVGLIGGAMTMQSFSIPIVTFLKEVDSAVTMTDFLAGFVKSFVFAMLVAGIGCLRGLQTGAGASAVGDSATKAVVSGIILLVVVDGIFAVALLPAEHMSASDNAEFDHSRGRHGRRLRGFVAILERVSFEVRPRPGVRHPRRLGCGKSTLMKHMIGLIPPIAGHVYIDGADIVTADAPTCSRSARKSA